MNNWLDSITAQDVKGRRDSENALTENPFLALSIARSIRHPWYRCQALARVAEEKSDSSECEPLLNEALAAAYELSEPNRIVSVACWPLRHLLGANPQAAHEVVLRLLSIISKEPHGLRKLDGIAEIFCTIAPSTELRNLVLEPFCNAASASRGWRTERIVASSAETMAKFDMQLASELIATRPASKFKRRFLATLHET